MLTPDELASLNGKVSALGALAASGDVDFDNPSLGYVNVMNPGIAAVPQPTPPPRRGSTPPPSPPAAAGPQGIPPCQ